MTAFPLLKDNDYVAALLRHRDEDVAARTLYTIALMIYWQAKAEQNKEPGLYDEKFGLAVWKLVEKQKSAA